MQYSDSIGPLKFCIIMHPITLNLMSDLRVAFLDDLKLRSKVDVVAPHCSADHPRVCSAQPSTQNIMKCKIVIQNNITTVDNPAFHNFKQIKR